VLLALKGTKKGNKKKGNLWKRLKRIVRAFKTVYRRVLSTLLPRSCNHQAHPLRVVLAFAASLVLGPLLLASLLLHCLCWEAPRAVDRWLGKCAFCCAKQLWLRCGWWKKMRKHPSRTRRKAANRGKQQPGSSSSTEGFVMSGPDEDGFDFAGILDGAYDGGVGGGVAERSEREGSGLLGEGSWSDDDDDDDSEFGSVLSEELDYATNEQGMLELQVNETKHAERRRLREELTEKGGGLGSISEKLGGGGGDSALEGSDAVSKMAESRFKAMHFTSKPLPRRLASSSSGGGGCFDDTEDLKVRKKQLVAMELGAPSKTDEDARLEELRLAGGGESEGFINDRANTPGRLEQPSTKSRFKYRY